MDILTSSKFIDSEYVDLVKYAVNENKKSSNVLELQKYVKVDKETILNDNINDLSGLTGQYQHGYAYSMLHNISLTDMIILDIDDIETLHLNFNGNVRHSFNKNSIIHCCEQIKKSFSLIESYNIYSTSRPLKNIQVTTNRYHLMFKLKRATDVSGFYRNTYNASVNCFGIQQFMRNSNYLNIRITQKKVKTPQRNSEIIKLI